MDKKLLTLLRVFLVTAAFGWGISVGGVFAPWSILSAQLQAMGARNIPSDPMIIYWLRMASAAFTFIGLLFLLAAINPRKYAALIPLLAIFLLLEGATLLFFGLALGCAITFWADSLFCLVAGSAILAIHLALNRPIRADSDS